MATKSSTKTQTAQYADLSRTLEGCLRSAGDYSIEAFYFVQEGLQFAADRVHGPAKATLTEPDGTRHINGRQLCEGLRAFALERWGLMARAVLSIWGVRSTGDFGRIVFAMIEAELLQKQPTDSLKDFANVYDFARAFDAGYRINLTAGNE